jgi:hypothetical protein
VVDAPPLESRVQQEALIDAAGADRSDRLLPSLSVETRIDDTCRIDGIELRIVGNLAPRERRTEPWALDQPLARHRSVPTERLRHQFPSLSGAFRSDDDYSVVGGQLP